MNASSFKYAGEPSVVSDFTHGEYLIFTRLTKVMSNLLNKQAPQNVWDFFKFLYNHSSTFLATYCDRAYFLVNTGSSL